MIYKRIFQSEIWVDRIPSVQLVFYGLQVLVCSFKMHHLILKPYLKPSLTFSKISLNFFSFSMHISYCFCLNSWIAAYKNKLPCTPTLCCCCGGCWMGCILISPILHLPNNIHTIWHLHVIKIIISLFWWKSMIELIYWHLAPKKQ